MWKKGQLFHEPLSKRARIAFRSLKMAFFFRAKLTKKPTDVFAPYLAAVKGQPFHLVFPCVIESHVYFCVVVCWVEMFVSREISFIFISVDLQMCNISKLCVIIKYLWVKIASVTYYNFWYSQKGSWHCRLNLQTSFCTKRINVDNMWISDSRLNHFRWVCEET